MEDPVVKCCLCEFSTYEEIDIKEHIITYHNVRRDYNLGLILNLCKAIPGDYSCFVCNNSYCNRTYLLNHICKPNPQPYQCQKCNKTFEYKSYLKRHEPVCKGNPIIIKANPF